MYIKGIFVAVQKSKRSRSRRDSRQAHNSLVRRELSYDKETNELHARHHVTAKGYYRGVKVIKDKVKKKENNSKSE
jgi:large subunit ribosomal protein L32